MNDKRREELQELIRSGANDAEHQEAAANTKSLADQRRVLMRKVEAADAAKKELAEAGPPKAAKADVKPKAEAKADAKAKSEPKSETKPRDKERESRRPLLRRQTNPL